MRDVYVLGVGQTPVYKRSELSLREMGARAVRRALADAGLLEQSARMLEESAGAGDANTDSAGARDAQPGVDALYVGNMMGATLSNQAQLGALIAQEAGLFGVEAATVEAACGSGGAAIRWGVMAIASGAHETVAVAGVERMTHVDRDTTIRGLATASDWEQEGGRGETFMTLNAGLMRAYVERYRVKPEAFAPFAVNAHSNAMGNVNALLKKPVTSQMYESAQMIAPPVRLFDASPICDGAAAAVLCTHDVAMRAKAAGRPVVRIAASASSTASVGLADRADPLDLDAARKSAGKAYQQAGIGPGDIDLFEAHDAYTIMSVLSLEACGFADRGCGIRLGQEGAIRPDGVIPLSTMGGLKARGHPVGATGVYQLVESTLQLREEGGANQVRNARRAMMQSFGGTAATVVTHVLERAA